MQLVKFNKRNVVFYMKKLTIPQNKMKICDFLNSFFQFNEFLLYRFVYVILKRLQIVFLSEKSL